MAQKHRYRVQVGLTLSPQCKKMLEELAEQMGMSQSGVVEYLIRKEAAARGIVIEDETEAAVA